MGDPKWYRRLPKWGQDLVDQLGHVGIGGVPAAVLGGCLLTILPAGWSGLIGAIAGALTMGLYETIQNVGDWDNDYEDMALDLSVGVSAAVLVGILVGVLA